MAPCIEQPTQTLWIYEISCPDEDFTDKFVGWTTIPYEQVQWALENVCGREPRPSHFENFELDEEFESFIMLNGGGHYWEVVELEVQEVSAIPDNITNRVQDWADQEHACTRSIFAW